MKFAIERYRDIGGYTYVVSEHIGGGAYRTIFYAPSNEECLFFIGKYVHEHNIEEFSVVDINGKQNDYTKLF